MRATILILAALACAPAYANQQPAERRTAICDSLREEVGDTGDQRAMAAFRAYCTDPVPQSEQQRAAAVAQAQVCAALRKRAISGEKAARFEFVEASKAGLCR